LRIYLDLILILNFCFDFILLGAVSIILRRNMGLKRLILASLFGAVSIFLLFIPMNGIMLLALKIIISIFMVVIAFGFVDFRYTIRNLMFLYIISFIMGGAIYALNLQFSYQHTGMIFFYEGISANWWFVSIVGPIIVYLFVKQALLLKNNYSNYYTVDIHLKNGKKYKVNAFLDTGNHLFEPYKGRPIILVDRKAIDFDSHLEEILLVPYSALNNEGLLKCIVPEKIHIKGIGIKKNVVIGIAQEKFKIDGVNCILHTRCM